MHLRRLRVSFLVKKRFSEEGLQTFSGAASLARAGRYNLAASPDWQALLTLFELNEGFAFIVLLVSNEEGAMVCRDALARPCRIGSRVA